GATVWRAAVLAYCAAYHWCLRIGRFFCRAIATPVARRGRGPCPAAGLPADASRSRRAGRRRIIVSAGTSSKSPVGGSPHSRSTPKQRRRNLSIGVEDGIFRRFRSQSADKNMIRLTRRFQRIFLRANESDSIPLVSTEGPPDALVAPCRLF